MQVGGAQHGSKPRQTHTEQSAFSITLTAMCMTAFYGYANTANGPSKLFG